MTFYSDTSCSKMASIEAFRLSLDEASRGPLAGLLNFWHRNADAERLPKKAIFYPEEHAALLGYMSLLEVRRGPVNFVFRLVGDHIANLLGKDLTNRSVGEVEPVAFSNLLDRHLLESTDLRQPTVYRVTAQWDVKKICYHRAILPLSRDGGLVDYLLTGSSQCDDTNVGSERLM